MKSRLWKSLLLYTSLCFLTSCGVPPAPEQRARLHKEGVPALELDRDNPLHVEGNTLYLYAEINDKYFHTSTHHGIVFTGGNKASQALFRAWANPLEVHDQLQTLGASPGNTLKYKDPKGSIVTGDRLQITVCWDEHRLTLQEALIYDPPLQDMSIRFGGNREASESFGTGCILCLDSCSVGITSNAAVGYWNIVDGKVSVTGNAETLPSGNQPVILEYTIFSDPPSND